MADPRRVIVVLLPSYVIFFIPHEMALELVYWGWGVAVPLPKPLPAGVGFAAAFRCTASMVPGLEPEACSTRACARDCRSDSRADALHFGQPEILGLLCCNFGTCHKHKAA